MKRSSFALALALVTAFIGGGIHSSAQAEELGKKFDHVFIIVFENTDYANTLKQPFFAKLVQNGALLQNMHAETHPSQPNYIAFISGSTNGVWGDFNQNVDAPHIGDLLEKSGLDWRVYAEGFPGKCFTGSSQGTYYRKHNPFISFRNVQKDPARCAKIGSGTQLDVDLKNGSLPAYSFYVPDIKNDGHDTGVAYADKYMEKRFGPLLSDPKFMARNLVIVTFDENEGTSGNQIYTMLIGDSVVPGSVSLEQVDHYSLLRMIEDNFGLAPITDGDKNAAAITGIWK